MSRERWTELDEYERDNLLTALNRIRIGDRSVAAADLNTGDWVVQVMLKLGFRGESTDWGNPNPITLVPTAAERECDQLRADNNRWREQGIAWVDQHLALAHENDQLRAERDQAITLLRRLRDEPPQTPATPYADGINDTLRIMRRLIEEAGLLDDEGQQR